MHTQTRRGGASTGLLERYWSRGLVAAACGGDNKSSSSTTAVTATAATRPPAGARHDGRRSSGLAQAQALLAQYTDRPTKLDLTTPVGKPIPTGKTIYQVTCGAEACDAESAMIKQATDLLGWNLKVLSTDAAHSRSRMLGSRSSVRSPMA